MKDDVSCFVAGPAVAAFDAEMEAVASGVLFTPDQWLFAKQNSRASLPAPRARGSVPPPVVSERTTQQIPVETLEELVKACKKKSLAHTCPAGRK